MTLGSLLALTLAPASSQAVPVKIELDGGRYSLIRGGKPYFIQGVGGRQDLDDLKAIGGNSIRTWGAEALEQDLTEARKYNLTVCAGIWLGHRRHGFRYDDPAAVAKQRDEALAVVRKFKDDPNVLVWGLGNEVELDGDDPRSYAAINEIAKAAKAIDPNHPTMTVIAEIGGNKIERIKTLCPDVDILGVNSYAGLSSLPARLKQAGWTKPYIVTEFGPPGPWEVGKTAWGAPIEPTSTAKAAAYELNFRNGIANQPQCLGGYAFLWGHKQEATATWFGMMLPSGEKTGAVDAMAAAWGKPRSNQAPKIGSIEIAGRNTELSTSSPIDVSVVAMDPEQDSLTFHWSVQAEQTDRGKGGDAEKAPPVLAETTTAEASGKVRFAPITKPGAYRVFLTVRDGRGNAATANLPFLVR